MTGCALSIQAATSRRSLLLFGVAAALVRPAAGRAAPNPGAVTPIRQLCDTLLQVMKAGTSTPFAQRFETMAVVVDRVFDLDAILRISVGASWSGLPPDQQAALRTAFRRYTVASYVNSFDNFNGQQFEVQPEPRTVPNGDEVVQTRIVSHSGESHVLAYVMHRSEGGWRAVDVLADGTISRVAVQRSDFRSILTRGGAPALVESLQTKTADLSEGTGR